MSKHFSTASASSSSIPNGANARESTFSLNAFRNNGFPVNIPLPETNTTASNNLPAQPRKRASISHSVVEILSKPEAEVSTRIFDHWRAYIAETVGTFFLFFVAFNISNVHVYTDLALKGDQNIIAVSFTIIALIFALGDVSGAHMNPAVTFCLVVVRAFPLKIGLIYWVMQFLGGFAAAGVSYALVKSNKMGEVELNGFKSMEPNFQATTMAGAFFVEYICSSFFYYIILATGVDTRGPEPRHHLAPLPIGFALGAAATLGASFGGVSLNPIGSIIPSIFANTYTNMWIYPLATLAAAFSVAIWYKLLFMSRPTQQEAEERKAMKLKSRYSVANIH